MGYETRIYFVEPYFKADNDGLTGCQVISMIDMCKIGRPSENGLIVPCDPIYYIWGSDGNTKISRDSYGDPLSYGEPEMVYLKMMANYMQEGQVYRRGALITNMLETFLSLKEGRFERLLVLGYGY